MPFENPLNWKYLKVRNIFDKLSTEDSKRKLPNPSLFLQ